MSALSVSPVAASASSAQASAQSGAPVDGADNSPFAVLLAAITAAEPDLQAPDLQTDVQSAAAQTTPRIDGQTPVPTGPQAANNDQTDPVTTTSDSDPAVDTAQVSSPDPSDVTASKSGGKPDKKASTDKTDSDAAPPLPVSSQMPLIPQPPIALMAQAAVQTQTVASNDNGSDISPAANIGASGAAGTTLPAQSGAVPGRKPVTLDPDASQPPSPQPSQPASDAKPVAAQSIAQSFAPANDDGADDSDAPSGTAATNQIKPTANIAGAKFTQIRNPGSKPVSQAAPQSQIPTPAADDADIDVQPPAAPSTAPNTSSQANTQISQTSPESTTQASTAPASTVPDSTAPASMAAVFPAPQAPQKPATDTAGKFAPDAVIGTPQTNAVATGAKDPAQSVQPSATAGSSSDSKPAHTAPVAPQGQTDAPQPHAATDAMPQATTVAINAAGPNAPSGLTLSVHVTSHDSDSQSSTQPAVTPDTDALAVSIAARSLSGSKQFDIRLDPPELGRVEVRLSIDASGKTQAHMTTDQPQTLALLQKDAPNLTRALRDAGLDVSQNGLNFSLKGQNQNQGGQNGNFGSPSRGLSLPAAAQSIEAAQSAGTLSSSLGSARLDIHV